MNWLLNGMNFGECYLKEWFDCEWAQVENGSVVVVFDKYFVYNNVIGFNK